MKKIAFDINHVLRDTFRKAEQIYQKFYIDEYDDENETFEYGLNLPVTNLSDLKSHFKFKDDQELFSFFYEEFTMQIFGNSPSMEMTTFNQLNKIYEDLRDENEILIISDEIGKSKPATLFFLSKYGCLVEKVKFFSKVTIDSLWEECDVIITANPELLLNAPDNIDLVKYESTYNKDIKSNTSISTLEEFDKLYKKLKIKENDFDFR